MQPSELTNSEFIESNIDNIDDIDSYIDKHYLSEGLITQYLCKLDLNTNDIDPASLQSAIDYISEVASDDNNFDIYKSKILKIISLILLHLENKDKILCRFSEDKKYIDIINKEANHNLIIMRRKKQVFDSK
jgi:hypothetical protein